jgi:hypothetical protein
MQVLIAYLHILSIISVMFERTAYSERINAKRLALLMKGVHAGDRMTANAWFDQIETRSVASSNVEAQELPFQRWYRFKEAFSPRFVSTALASLSRRPKACIDPFGGSGTTSLTCQFLGVKPVTIEINPFLADLIEAKLQQYDLSALMHEYGVLQADIKSFKGPTSHLLSGAPNTFVEPGVDGRWIFDKSVARRFLVHREAICRLTNETHRRLFRILLGSIAVPLSNVVISGKGRRYRGNWNARTTPADQVDTLFRKVAEQAIQDIAYYGRRAEQDYLLLRGDSRELVGSAPEAEFCLFSPPYPNSFDYTDIYNVELWLLGYLTSTAENRSLRESTLRSHVQIKRSYDGDIPPSPTLKKTVKALERHVGKLWNPDIPAMVQAYFSDIAKIIQGLSQTMAPQADVMMVIGDSRYAGVRVDVATICAEIAPAFGFRMKSANPIRAMRASAQQGGNHVLSETLLYLRRQKR